MILGLEKCLLFKTSLIVLDSSGAKKVCDKTLDIYYACLFMDLNSSLLSRQIYGVQPNVNPGVLGIDDNTIAYVSGHNIVILNVESK